MIKIKPLKKNIIVLAAVLIFSYAINVSFAQTPQESQSSLYVPLIGITSVPEPLALPDGPGNVTYRYAVKNFLEELSLTNIQVVDDKCTPVKFIEGDDNGNSKLDSSETWRYSCTVKVSETTQSIATAIGIVNDITTTHKAYTTVVVGLDTPPPLVSIVNIAKIAYPLALPPEGGAVNFTYKVNNPGVAPLSNITVTDNKCSNMSSKLGDTNGNNLLDTSEVWIYTCTMFLEETTTNTATVVAFSGGFKAVGETTVTVKVQSVALPEAGNVPGFPDQRIPSFPETGVNPNFKIIVWAILSGVSAGLITFLFLNRIYGMRGISARRLPAGRQGSLSKDGQAASDEKNKPE